jgi:hypothetical protein
MGSVEELLARHSQESSEGSPVALSMPRKRRWKRWVFVGVLAFGVWLVGCHNSSPRTTAAPLPPPSTQVIPVGSAFAPRVVAEAEGVFGKKKGPVVRALWVGGGHAGIQIDDETFEVVAGDRVNGLLIGMLGPKYVDVSDGYSARRLTVSSPTAAHSYGSVRGGSGGDGYRPVAAKRGSD